MSYIKAPDSLRLGHANVGANSIQVDWSEVELEDYTVVASHVTEDVLRKNDAHPDDLRARGEELPDDADEAFVEAARLFMDGDGYNDWIDGNRPLMNYLWPLDTAADLQYAATAIEEAGLDCAIVDSSPHGVGIVMTGAGMDLSDHVAAAYILAGAVPPASVISAALSHHSPVMPEHLAVAAAMAAEHLRTQAERIEEGVERLANRSPAPGR